jgi:hypothetical protein
MSKAHLLKAARMEPGSFEEQYYWNQANITGHCGESFDLGYVPYCCCQEHSSEGGIVAWVYFTIFTILGALVLMTLFIGVITTSMEEAQEENDKEREDEEAVKKIVLEAGWGPAMTQQYTIAFKMLDVDGTGSIDKDELRDGLELFGRSVTDDELETLIEAAKVDVSDCLDFPSFVTLMVNVTKKKREKNMNTSSMKKMVGDGGSSVGDVQETSKIKIKEEKKKERIKDNVFLPESKKEVVSFCFLFAPLIFFFFCSLFSPFQLILYHVNYFSLI